MHCPVCGREIARQTVEQIVDQLYDLPEGTRLMLLAPLVRDRKGEHEKLLAGAKQAGFVRVRVDGELRDLDEEIPLDKKFKHSIEVVVDRLAVHHADEDGAERPDASRMADSIETALRMSDGTLLVHLPDDGPEGQRSPLQRALRLSRARRQLRGAGAAQLQLQLAAWGLPRLHGAWQSRWRSIPSWCSRIRHSRSRRAPCSRGGGWWRPRRGSRRSSTRWPSDTASAPTRRSASSPLTRARSCCAATTGSG